MVQTISAVLLAVPSLSFGSSYFVHVYPLDAMRAGAVTAGYVIASALLLVPGTRFVGALLHLPITLGLLAFQVFTQASELPLMLCLVALNIGAHADRQRLAAMLGVTCRDVADCVVVHRRSTLRDGLSPIHPVAGVAVPPAAMRS